MDGPGIAAHFFRRGYGRLVAFLSRKVGARNIEAVEDAVQNALASAVATWPVKGLPDNAGAWLYRIAPSPLNNLNQAVAMTEWKGAEAGLDLLKGMGRPVWLTGFHLWDAVLGELYRRAGRFEEARHHPERALSSAPTEAERTLLGRRLAALSPGKS